VWKFYHDRRQEAQSGCKLELESGSAANACQSLDNLEKLVYEVAYTGDAEQLYHQLKVGRLSPSGQPVLAADVAVVSWPCI
jgi:hypothetical protein